MLYTTIRLTGHSKLPVGVNVSVDGCLSLYVSPAMNNQLIQGNVAFAKDAEIPPPGALFYAIIMIRGFA